MPTKRLTTKDVQRKGKCEKIIKNSADKDEQTRQTRQTVQTVVKIDSETDSDICTYLGRR